MVRVVVEDSLEDAPNSIAVLSACVVDVIRFLVVASLAGCVAPTRLRCGARSVCRRPHLVKSRRVEVVDNIGDVVGIVIVWCRDQEDIRSELRKPAVSYSQLSSGLTV